MSDCNLENPGGLGITSDAAERRDRLTAHQADDLRTQAEDITIKLLDC